MVLLKELVYFQSPDCTFLSSKVRFSHYKIITAVKTGHFKFKKNTPKAMLHGVFQANININGR